MDSYGEMIQLNLSEGLIPTLNSKLEAVFDLICKEEGQPSWVEDDEPTPSIISKESRKIFEQQVTEMHRLEDDLVRSCPKNEDGSISPKEELLELFFDIKLPNPPSDDNIHSYQIDLDKFHQLIDRCKDENEVIDE
jgi:hypothetical protein